MYNIKYIVIRYDTNVNPECKIDFQWDLPWDYDS